MKINAIITGSTGMVGEGVLHECIQNPRVEKILIINRKHYNINHPKVTEIIHGNFFDLSALEDRLHDFNACFFCLGVSSIGMKEDDYRKITYDLTMNFAKTLARLNPDMTFCYVSGSGTDSSEKGKLMWARIKGKTENDLMKLPFKKVYVFRPGYMHPTPGLKNVLKYLKYFTWLYPVLKVIFPNHVSTLKQLADSMINAVLKGYDKQVLEVKDIKKLSGE